MGSSVAGYIGKFRNYVWGGIALAVILSSVLGMVQGDLGVSLGLILVLVGLVFGLLWELAYQRLCVTPEELARVAQSSIAQDHELFFDSSVSRVAHRLPLSFSEYITNAGRSGVDLLGGLFDDFTLKEENLRALRTVYAEGGVVRILMLDPEGEGIVNLWKQRSVLKNESLDEFRAGARRSLCRFEHHLGPDGVVKCVRLYNHTPRNSVYRMGSFYLSTIYRFGSGGSSPTIAMRKIDENDAFCDALIAGFNDIWDRASQPVTPNSAPVITSASP